VQLLGVSNSALFGSDAAVYVEEIVAGNAATLMGPNPTLTVFEKAAGLPSYTSTYTVDTPGKYLTKVSQLAVGGCTRSTTTTSGSMASVSAWTRPSTSSGPPAW
jgi:hypothetical protein